MKNIDNPLPQANRTFYVLYCGKPNFMMMPQVFWKHIQKQTDCLLGKTCFARKSSRQTWLGIICSCANICDVSIDSLKSWQTPKKTSRKTTSITSMLWTSLAISALPLRRACTVNLWFIVYWKCVRCWPVHSRNGMFITFAWINSLWTPAVIISSRKERCFRISFSTC